MIGVLIVYRVYRFCEPSDKGSYEDMFTDIFYEKLLEDALFWPGDASSIDGNNGPTEDYYEK